MENIEQLETEKETLIGEIAALKSEKAKLLSDKTIDVETAIRNLVLEGTRALEEKKQNLITTIEKLERRQARIEKEMRTTFSGASQDLAIQVKGFKDYLVGSLQDLTAAAEKLQVPKRAVRERPQRQPEKYSREREPVCCSSLCESVGSRRFSATDPKNTPYFRTLSDESRLLWPFLAASPYL